MIVEEIKGDLIRRYSDDESKRLHKVDTDEYYKEAYDLVISPYIYEEVDDPYYNPESDSDSDVDLKKEKDSK